MRVMNIPLEDNFADILGKAQRGLGISDTEVAEKAGVRPEKIRGLRNGEFDEQALLRVAPVLGLAPRALVDLAKGNWQPQEIQLDGLAQLSTHYGEMLVNAYLIWDPETKDAAAFDTGADCSEMLQLAKKNKLNIRLILARPVAVVGDSLFAGSMGGGNVSYNDALRNNLEKILTLSDETIICPGHGPMTTVGEEKEHNPFFAGKV